MNGISPNSKGKKYLSLIQLLNAVSHLSMKDWKNFTGHTEKKAWSYWVSPRTISAVRNQGAIRSEEHTSELQSLMRISYAVFCLTKKTSQTTHNNIHITYNLLTQQLNLTNIIKKSFTN